MNADKHFKTIAAVLIVLTRNNKNGDTEYLLQKRQNTGFADGMWVFSASGHVEKDKPMTKTVCREANEEIGINVQPNDVEFVGMFHSMRVDNQLHFLVCFKVVNYSGEIKIGEPDKIAELRWFSDKSLPKDIIKSRKIALDYCSRGRIFIMSLVGSQNSRNH